MNNNELMKYVGNFIKSPDFTILADAYDSSDYREIIKYIYLNAENFIKFYEEFKKNGNNFTLNNKGIIDIESFPTILSNRFIDSAVFSKGWYVLPNFKCALLKQIPSYKRWGKNADSDSWKDEFNDYTSSLRTKQIDDNEYHILLVPEIAKQIGIECAEYYLAKTAEGYGFSLSPSFLNEGEELISGDTIVGKNTLDMNRMTFFIKNYCSDKNISQKDIDKITFDFIKQSFFNCLIDNLDERNVNWGMISNKKELRIAPVFDIDLSCDVYRIDSESNRTLSDGFCSIESFIKQYSNFPGFMNFIKNVIENFNIENAFESVYEKHNIKIPVSAQDTLKIFFDDQLTQTKEVYDLCEKSKKDYER